MPLSSEAIDHEEQVVSALETLGIRYLSRQSETHPVQPCVLHQLMADLVRQPSSRVRAALISLLFVHPEHAACALDALDLLQDEHARSFKFFYTAAVILQAEYKPALSVFLGPDYQILPDLFSNELGITGGTPDERLRSLAWLHAKHTGLHLNWVGTYQNAAIHLLHRWEIEQQWNR